MFTQNPPPSASTRSGVSLRNGWLPVCFKVVPSLDLLYYNYAKTSKPYGTALLSVSTHLHRIPLLDWSFFHYLGSVGHLVIPKHTFCALIVWRIRELVRKRNVLDVAAGQIPLAASISRAFFQREKLQA